ncbi:hypothetical protein ACI784_08785 [Geodermatophilus sp. SYSU D01186]
MIVRRAVTVLATATLMVLGGQQLAGAAFGDSASVATTVGTLTVAPVTGLSATAPCTLTTTTTTTTTRKAADGTVIGQSTVTESSSTTVTTPVRSYPPASTETTTNPDGTTTTTTRQTTQDTTVSGVATWQRSTTPNVTSYTLTIPGPAPYSADLGDTTQFTYAPISIDQNYTLPITVTARTSYGWAANATVMVSTCRQ